MVERLHNEFIRDDNLLKATMMRFQKRDNFQLWHDMDVEEGIEKGIIVGKREVINDLVQAKYPNEDHDWLKDCTLEQLNIVVCSMVKDLNYQEFKNLIIKEESI